MSARLPMDKKLEEEKFFDFLEKKCKRTEAPLKLMDMTREFIQKSRSRTEPDVLRAVIPGFSRRIWKIEDRNRMARLLFGLSLPVSSARRRRLRYYAKIVLRKERIVLYRARDGTLTLQNNAVQTQAGQRRQFFEHLTEKCKETKCILLKKDLIRDYLAVHNEPCATTLGEWFDEYRKKVFRKPYLDLNTKVKILFVLSAPIGSQLFVELKYMAQVVERNKKLAIKKFISKDGKLRFENFECFNDGEEEEEEEEDDDNILQ